jgi:hypothetical protein
MSPNLLQRGVLVIGAGMTWVGAAMGKGELTREAIVVSFAAITYFLYLATASLRKPPSAP